MALGVGLSCAKRTDERVRKAWGNASKAPAEGPSDRGGPDDAQGGDTEAQPIRVGWERLEEILDTALSETAVGTDDETMARLAERWCQVQPVPRDTADGPVLVCIPNPPVQIDGHAFTLELGGEGVIGLVATELSLADGSALAEEAVRKTEHWCTRPWTDATPRPTADQPPPPTADRLFTCPVEGSALLVVARFVTDEATGLWQVSVAVIDAS
ncbi:hypothetical protein [Paraliomyxa miuraensis]|uniref:hypothetical protein n=1 Tax=Paraliomyxa miuraensis TaxID=376150 RepID=UPI002252C4FF|nr:hypothetical protein [Paraliomyxa miuraensis]MCX4244360.1 hypothetical protein [Paraliomyxa miuraensis]